MHVADHTLYEIQLHNHTVEYVFNITAYMKDQTIENVVNMSILLDPLHNYREVAEITHGVSSIVHSNPQVILPYMVTVYDNSTSTDLSKLSAAQERIPEAETVASEKLAEFMKTTHNVTSYSVTRSRIDSIFIHLGSPYFTFVNEVHVAEQQKSYYVILNANFVPGKTPSAYAFDTKRW